MADSKSAARKGVRVRISPAVSVGGSGAEAPSISWAAALGALRAHWFRLTLALLVGVVAGGLQQWSVRHVGHVLVPLSFTAAPWVLIAYAVASNTRRMGEAVIMGTVMLLAATVSFYLAQASRGWELNRDQVVFWLAAGVLVGPVVGVAAGWVRHHGQRRGPVGAGVIGGMLIGESAHGLRDLGTWTDPTYWAVEIAVGLGLALAVSLWLCRSGWRVELRGVILTLAACAAAGLATFVVYQLPILA